MARDPSPLSKRLKALAVRAGLPVESGPTAGTAPATPAPAPDDEQPTGEFPAVAAAGTPDDDQPTGEFPAVAATEPPGVVVPTSETPDALSSEPTVLDAQPSGAVPPPLRDEAPAASSPDETPRPAVPPIWTDSPAESQSPLTAGAADGPTLPPPTLTPLAKPFEAPIEPVEQPAEPEEPTPEPTALHEVGEPTSPEPEAEPESEPVVEEPSRAAQLDEALALEPEPAADTSAAEADVGPAATEVDPPTVVALPDSAAGRADTDAEPTGDALVPDSGTTETPAVDAAAVDSSASEAEQASATAPAAPPDKLSLTGRIAAIRRRVRPAAPAQPTPDPQTADAATHPALDAPAAEASPEPAPAAQADAPLPPPVAVVVDHVPADADADADTAAHEEPLAKPSFSERAALRRRVKTLRARRDAGLLELGAITIDQRRFGDPTAGTLLRRRTDDLVDLDNEIAAIEHALDEHASATALSALRTVRCLGCGSLVGPADRYCSHCGTPRPTDAAPASARPDQAS